MNKLAIFFISFCTVQLLANTPPNVSNVRASQCDGTKLVDIYYDVTDVDSDALRIRVEISENNGKSFAVPAFSFSGDIGDGVLPGENKHIVWDAEKDWDGEYSEEMLVKVIAIDGKGYAGLPWGDEIRPGGFLLGQDGGAEGSGESRHVNILWSYWLSKYEISSMEYCNFLNQALSSGHIERSGTTAVYLKSNANLIPGLNGRYLLLNIGDSYDIRWNVNKFQVVGDYTNFPVRATWYGAMAFAHYYGYDLPTEAEWEKAARGPEFDDEDEHLVYPWGNSISNSCANYARAADTVYSSKRITPVGYYNGLQVPAGDDMKNGYGLYDMAGNVAEWTLTATRDEYSVENYPEKESLLSPRNVVQYGESAPAIIRGGSFNGNVQIFNRSKSALRGTYDSTFGFRVCRRDYDDRAEPTLALTQNFESWPAKEMTSGDVTVDGWVLSKETFIGSDASLAFSGTKYLGAVSINSSLYLPPLSGELAEVRLKVYNKSSSNRVISLLSKNGNSSRGNNVIIPPSAGYTNISLTPLASGESYYIFSEGLFLDDVEVYIIPKTN